MGNKNETYEKITANIVASLEKAIAEGTSPAWVKPWASCGANRNAFTNRPYNGINSIILSFSAFKDPRWATFNQIAKEGGMVKKGSKATQVILWRFLEKTNKTTGKKEKIPLMRTFNVFNVAEQTEGIALKPLTPVVGDVSGRFAEADLALETILAGVDHSYGGDQAFYTPAFDSITMPTFESFKSAKGFYATWFHELGHWTGHTTRLNRKGDEGLAGREGYAFEELVAELTSTFVARDLGIDSEESQNAKAYLASWLKALKNEPSFIFKASSLAQKAATLILEGMGVKVAVTEEVAEEVAA